MHKHYLLHPLYEYSNIQANSLDKFPYPQSRQP